MKGKSELEVVEILRISELPDRAFAEVRTQEGEVHWEEISLEEARRERRKLGFFRVIKKRTKRDVAPAIRPVVRIGASGIVGFGSNLLYKGMGGDGCPEYWHIPSGTILVGEADYAARQIASTLFILEEWAAQEELQIKCESHQEDL